MAVRMSRFELALRECQSFSLQEEELPRAGYIVVDGDTSSFPSSLFILLSSWRNVYMHADNSRDSWWIYHHYSAKTMALVSLTWEITGEPDSAKKQTAVQLFLQWAMMQGGAMLMQSRYQRQRRLTCVALRRPMEWICLEETVGVSLPKQTAVRVTRICC